MEGQQYKLGDSYSDESSGWYSDSYPELNASSYPDSDSYTDSYSGSYPDSYPYSGPYTDSDSYSDVYFKEEDSPTSKGPEFSDKMKEEVSENNSQEVSNMAALTGTLPLVTAILALLLVVSWIFLWKKTLKRERSRRVSKSSANNKITQDEVEGTKNPPEHHSTEVSLSSLEHHFSSGNGKVEEGAIAKGKVSVDEAEYAEIDENVHEMYQRTIFKVDIDQPGSEYMAVDRNSANDSVYEKLKHQRRRSEVDNTITKDIKEV